MSYDSKCNKPRKLTISMTLYNKMKPYHFYRQHPKFSSYKKTHRIKRVPGPAAPLPKVHLHAPKNTMRCARWLGACEPSGRDLCPALCAALWPGELALAPAARPPRASSEMRPRTWDACKTRTPSCRVPGPRSSWRRSWMTRSPSGGSSSPTGAGSS